MVMRNVGIFMRFLESMIMRIRTINHARGFSDGKTHDRLQKSEYNYFNC